MSTKLDIYLFLKLNIMIILMFMKNTFLHIKNVLIITIILKGTIEKRC